MKTKLLLLAIASLCFVTEVKSSHVAGLVITYQYTGTGNDYNVRLKYYNDCAGVAASAYWSMQISSVSCGLSINPNLPQISFSQVPVNACSVPGLTACQGGANLGYMEYIYEAVVSIPPCADWVASTSICCRNNGISNLINPDVYNSYVETRFDNLNFPGNSSPGFNTIPVKYYCAGVQSVKDYSAFDIDGDSLRYELVPVLNASSAPIPMAPGYTYDQPLASFIPTYLDSLNGMLLFTPSFLQLSTLGVKVSEFRNGMLIGTILIDDEIVVTSVIANPDTISGRVYIDYNTNGIYDLGDQAIANAIVELSPGNVFTTTAGNGKYDFYTSDGIFNISIPNTPLYTTLLPTSINVNTNGITFSGNNDFNLQIVPNSNDLEIYINNNGAPIPGQIYPINITYNNIGTTTQTNIAITLTLDSLLHFTSSLPVPAMIFGNSITWNFPTIPPFSTADITVICSVDTLATIGTPIYYSATITPIVNDLTPANNLDFINANIATSCDPNFKEVSPAGNIELPSIIAQDWLTYTIHFQNLGNAPAQMIRISDFLDTDLDFSSLEFITSSFPCAMTLSNPNELEFTFFGINLPAASVNEPASHGFVEYRIRPKASLVPGMYILNNAGIYFDFNAPVYTNLVQNLIVTPVGISENPVKRDQILVYPNPASENITLELFSSDSRNVQIEIYNLVGALVKKSEQKLISGLNQFPIGVSELPNGGYFISVNKSDGKIFSKFNIMRE